MEQPPWASLALPTSVAPEEREAVAEWLSRARLSGIELLQDLRDRPWPVVTDAAILGVFRTGEVRATWLIVGQDDSWAVASCERNEVIGSNPSLAGALAMILPGRAAQAAFEPHRPCSGSVPPSVN